MLRRERPTEPLVQRLKRNTSAHEYEQLRGLLPTRLQHVLRYVWFKPAWHREILGLKKRFVSRLGPRTRVLEIGAGTGRLADYLLRNSRLRPENYWMVDELYGRNGERPQLYVRANIFRLANQRRIPMRQASMFDLEAMANLLKGQRFNHILLPESLFDPEEGARLEGRTPREAGAALARLLIEHLRKGGTLRFSHAGEHFDSQERVATPQLDKSMPMTAGFADAVYESIRTGRLRIIRRSRSMEETGGVVAQKTR